MSASVPAVLKECHRLRKLLRDLDAEIDLGPRVSKAQLKVREAAEKDHAAAHAAVAALKLRIREEEGTVRQLNTQLAKFEKQLETAGKEFEAKQTEIRHTKERVAAAEEGVLTMMEQLDAAVAALPEADATWAAAQRQYDQDQIDGKERLERLTADRARAAAELTGVELALPADTRAQYDRLVKRHGADGLAGVVGRVCQNCRTGMTEQQKLDLQAGRFLCCSNCGRGLYLAG